MVDKVTVKIDADAKGFKKGVNSAEKETKSFGKQLKTLSKNAAIAFTAVGAAALGAVKIFADFETTFTNVVTLLDDTSFAELPLEQGIEGLKDGILELRAETGETFDDLNKGLFDLVSAGVDAGSALDVLAVATELAAAGGTDVSVAVDGMTSAMNAFGFEASDATDISAAFFTAQKFGKTTIEELSASLGKVAPTAAAMGISFEELLAATSAVTLQGISTSEAMTGLSATLANVVKPTADAIAEAERLGLEFNQTALQSQGLSGFLNDIIVAADGNKESLTKLFGSIEAVKTVFALTKDEASDFNNILKELNDTEQANATFAAAVEVATNTTAKSFARMSGAAESLAVILGEQLSPFFNEVAEGALFLAKAIKESVTSSQEAVSKYDDISHALGELLIREEELQKQQEEGNIITRNVAAFRLSIVQDGIERLQEQREILQEQEDEANALALEKRIENEELEKERIAEAQAAELAKKDEDIATAVEKLANQEQLAQKVFAANTKKRVDDLAGRENLKEDLLAIRKKLRDDLKVAEEIEDDKSRLEEIRKISEQLTKVAVVEAKANITRQSVIAKIAQEKAEREAAADSQEIKDTIKHGDAVAKINKFLQSDNVQGVKSTVGQLAQLQQSGNAKQRAVGKAAALIQVGISTAEGAIKAFTSLSGIPFVGPALGAAAAGALTLFGLERANDIRKAQSGGLVTGGVTGVDTEPFLLSRGESIIPADLTPDLLNTFDEIRSVRQGGGLASVISSPQATGIAGTDTILTDALVETLDELNEMLENGINVNIILNENAAQVIDVQQEEDRQLNII